MDRYNWAEIGGVHFDGAPTGPAGTHLGFLLYTIAGWRGLPSSRGRNDPIPGAHGSFEPEELLRAERSMALSGAIRGNNPAHALALLEQLEAALATRLVEMRVCDDSGVWSRMVEVEAIRPPAQWNRARIPITIDLIAPDPVRYQDWVRSGPAGLPTHTGGLILPSAFPWDFGSSDRPIAPVLNGGRLPVYPVMTLQSEDPNVVASADSVVLHGGPRRISFGAFSGVLSFDSRDRRAYLNGVDVTRQMIRRDWPVVQPGESLDFYFEAVNPSLPTALTVDYRIGAW